MAHTSGASGNSRNWSSKRLNVDAVPISTACELVDEVACRKEVSQSGYRPSEHRTFAIDTCASRFFANPHNLDDSIRNSCLPRPIAFTGIASVMNRKVLAGQLFEPLWRRSMTRSKRKG
jgi:hypothetical protein